MSRSSGNVLNTRTNLRPDSAGLLFVSNAPGKAATTAATDRKAIGSHVRKSRGRRHPNVRSWINPARTIGGVNLCVAPPVGSAFSALQLPSGVEPSMIQDLVICEYLNFPRASNGTKKLIHDEY